MKIIKAVVLVLVVSGCAYAMDCGLYYFYGTAEYAACRDGNQRRDEDVHRAKMADLNAWSQSNREQEQAQQAQAQAEYDAIQLRQALQNQRGYGK